jgi:ubiquitin conjugation factor E4 B
VSKPSNETQSITEWEDETISHIFRVSLAEGVITDAAGRKLLPMRGHRQELLDDGLPLLLSKDRLDAIILEAASMAPAHRSILDYLLPCWKRIVKAQKGLRGYTNEKDVILKEARRLCMSYMIFAMEVPDLFGYVRNVSEKGANF